MAGGVPPAISIFAPIIATAFLLVFCNTCQKNVTPSFFLPPGSWLGGLVG
jgi:hypothetical protein